MYQQIARTQSAGQPFEERYRLALSKFQDVQSSYAGTSSGIKALFYMAECYYRLGDYDKAIDYYTQFVDKSQKGNYLISFAYEGLGYCHEEKGDCEQALQYYKKSLEQNTLDLRKMEYLNIARCYETLNDKTQALEYYKKLENEQSDSLVAELVQDKINTLASD
jgi:tetratricopeptide (TPR) repeat protein